LAGGELANVAGLFLHLPGNRLRFSFFAISLQVELRNLSSLAKNAADFLKFLSSFKPNVLLKLGCFRRLDLGQLCPTRGPHVAQ